MSFLARHGRRLLAIAIVAAIYPMTTLPSASSDEVASLARRFRFEATELPGLGDHLDRHLRRVHPSLQKHAAWISTVGAAVSLCDLDGDGLPNDVVYVETRSDRVIVAPVPGVAEASRYAPFALEPGPHVAHEHATTAPMGSIAGDFNEDGRLDVLVYYWGRTPVLYLRRESSAAGAPLDGSAFYSVDVKPGGELWYTNALSSADIDGDGHVDLIVGNYFQDGSRILDPRATGCEAMQDSMSRAYNGGRNRVLRFTGCDPPSGDDGCAVPHFEDVEGVFSDEVAGGWTLGIGAADLDGDLLPEIYFANDFGPDRLLHNRSRPGEPRLAVLHGPKGLRTPNSKALGRDSFKGMGVDFGDINGDGFLDIYVSNIADEYALEESHFVWVSSGDPSVMHRGVAPYVDESEPLGLSRSGWGWESRLADFDNDGILEAIQATGFVKGQVNRWPELHELAMGNDRLVQHASCWPRVQVGDDLSGHQHNPFFVRSESGRYVDLAAELGLDEPWVSRGIATADVDGDGDLDFALANQWEPSIFYRNDGDGPGRGFLGLDLLLPLDGGAADAVSARSGHHATHAAGRPAVGASVRVNLRDGRVLVGQVDGGNGHSGARSHQLHFGLGASSPDEPVTVEIRWRDSGGVARRAEVALQAGWHTVMLGVAP